MKTSSLRVAALAVLISVASAASQTAAPPDRFFDSTGVQIRYVEQGAGPPVILLHGNTGTLDPAVSEVEPLKKAHPQIKTLVLEGATHGGEQGVLRRTETMTALREMWDETRR